MLAVVKDDLPFQPMLVQSPLQVIRLEGFFDASSLEAHRHDFYMLCWATKGVGVHRIGYGEFDWGPGRAFFLPRNQVHQVVRYPDDGWMILFDGMLFRNFIKLNPEQEGFGLFDFFNPRPYVDLDRRVLDACNRVAADLLSDALSLNLLPVVQHYLSVLLLYVGQQYQASHDLSYTLPEAGLVIKLKRLISGHYTVHRDPAFYGGQLGVPSRRLNEICRAVTGKGVYELVIDHLLTECESLLALKVKPVKEICFEMGFTDPANFTTFFKKHRGLTPVEFRMMVTSGMPRIQPF